MWQIMGSGAIACLWAANLLRSGQEVHIISRKKLQVEHLIYHNLAGETLTFPCSHSTALSSKSAPILVCVKAPQVKAALMAHLQNIQPEQAIILMHNGMGCAEQVAEILPNNPILCATTANGALLNGPLEITHSGAGITYLGPYNQPAKSQVALTYSLNKALDNCFWCDDIQQKLWLKLFINIAINPLTAINQIANGDLSKQCYQAQLSQLLEEACLVAKAENLPFTKAGLFETVNHVIACTAPNYSSMNRDLYFKRDTENEFINGYLIKKALQHKIATPLIESLYNQIKGLENHSLTQ